MVEKIVPKIDKDHLCRVSVEKKVTKNDVRGRYTRKSCELNLASHVCNTVSKPVSKNLQIIYENIKKKKYKKEK